MSATQDKLRVCPTKTRVFILTDIANEPDDAESFVRYLLYANEFDTRGLVACTSCHMKSKVAPEQLEHILDGYAQVVENLNHHAHPQNQYPPAQDLRSLVRRGPAVYGKLALAPDVTLSEGSKLLIDRVDESELPLWVLCWGGTNTLAQVVQHVQKTRDAERSALFRSKLRVYAISDQDDTGAWLRIQFPDIFYICSVHGWCQYNCAAWTGISAGPDIGADPSQFTRDWLREHIQLGPLGSRYPDFKFLVEGDTPTFLYLIQNGLGHPEHPHWGSWGGRYSFYDPGMSGKHFADALDSVVGVDGKTYTSNYATIWRWRSAFQNDFAARMQWTLTGDTGAANHAPVVFVNDSDGGPAPLLIEAEGGETVVLDASKSYDPDGDALTFKWFQYREPSTVQGLVPPMIPNIDIVDLDPARPGTKVQITVPPYHVSGLEQLSGQPVAKGHEYHFVLEVKDNGTPPLTTYRRVVVQATNRELRGQRATVADTTADWMEMFSHLQVLCRMRADNRRPFSGSST